MPGFLAGCGSFLIFAAFALLLVSSLSAPVFYPISLLDLYDNGARSTFGVWGYCVDNSSGCSARRLGYNLPGALGQIAGVQYENESLVRLTRALVLHPIACGIAFLAFLVAALSERFGYIFSSILCFLAFLVSLVAMAIDFGLFVAARNYINNNAGGFFGNVGAGQVAGVSASLGNAIWMTLAATICLFLASFVVCFGICSGRKERRERVGNGYADGPGYSARWYQRGPKY